MPIQKIKIIFSKISDMRFISHLDLVRLFQRVLRRADLPVAITQGYSPRIKISISRALKLGVESRAEEAVFYMDRHIEPSDFIKRFNEKSPQGVAVLTAEEIN